VELYEPANLARVLRMGARLVGVNNRDLHTFQVDLEHTLQLRRAIPSDRIVVSESGIRSRQDAQRLEAAGVQAMLVGESLMARPDIGAAVDELLGKGEGGGRKAKSEGGRTAEVGPYEPRDTSSSFM